MFIYLGLEVVVAPVSGPFNVVIGLEFSFCLLKNWFTPDHVFKWRLQQTSKKLVCVSRHLKTLKC